MEESVGVCRGSRRCWRGRRWPGSVSSTRAWQAPRTRSTWSSRRGNDWRPSRTDTRRRLLADGAIRDAAGSHAGL